MKTIDRSAERPQDVVMDATEATQHDGLTEAELRSWDWDAELRAQERSIPWLARRTDRGQGTVYSYRSGKMSPSLDWLRSAARVLGKGAAS
jgi:hypothetical protein